MLVVKWCQGQTLVSNSTITDENAADENAIKIMLATKTLLLLVSTLPFCQVW